MIIWRIGCVMGASSILLGAFGAHSLKKTVNNDLSKIKAWETAAHYQLVHSIAILAISALPKQTGYVSLASSLWICGTILFSGSIYALVGMKDAAPRWLGPVTPVGGITLTAGWLVASLIL